jgi:hypothetical protein
MTGIFLKANRLVSNTVDATVEIYEASSADSAVVINDLITAPLSRGESLTLNPIYVKVDKDSYINARTDDDDVQVTILGFYIEDLDG